MDGRDSDCSKAPSEELEGMAVVADAASMIRSYTAGSTLISTTAAPALCRRPVKGHGR